MVIRVGNDPQHPCRRVNTQQVITRTNYMDVVDHCLHVSPCNINNMASIQPVIFQ